MLWSMAQLGYSGARRLRLFAASCALRNRPLLVDARAVRSVEVATRFAQGQAPIEELRRAFVAAKAAAVEAVMRPDWTAALACAMTAAAHVARENAFDAARDAASHGARAAAWDIRRDTTLEAEEAWQTDELRRIIGSDMKPLLQRASTA
jgi:hypothetical protein